MSSTTVDEMESVDMMSVFAILAKRATRGNQDLMRRLRGDGARWGAIRSYIAKAFNGNVEDAGQLAFDLVAPTLTQIFGPKGEGWTDFRKDNKPYAVVRKQ